MLIVGPSRPHLDLIRVYVIIYMVSNRGYKY